MAESVREQALVQVVAKLATMTGTRPWGGSYPSDPVVEREYKTLETVNRFPHLIVIEDDGSPFEPFEVGPGGDGHFKHGFNFQVYGYVARSNGQTRSTWLQRLWDDVVRTIQKNRSLGGVASDVIVLPDLVVDGGDSEPVGGFRQGFAAVLYESMPVE